MKLVNARKLILSILLITGFNAAQAQEVWTLKTCLDTAQAYNKTLQINRNNIELSEEREKEAKANMNPKLAVNADYKYFINLPHQLLPLSTFNASAPEGQFKEAQFGVPHNINANLQFTMPLINPQIKAGIQNSKLASELTQLQYQKTEEQVLFDITTLYYNAQIIKHQLNFLDSNLINSQKLLKNLQLLHDQKMAKGTDVNKVKLQADQLTTQRENVNNKYIQILNALKLNMGIGIENNLTVETDIRFKTDLEYASKDILDLKIIRTQNKLLSAELNTLNKSRYAPTLSLIASYGASGFGYDKSPNGFLKFFPVGFAGVQFTYPLFNGSVTTKKINQKKLELNNNELQSQIVSDKNEMEIENANRQRVVAEKTISTTEAQIELAQTIYDQTLLQQKLGTASLTDILLADNALREAQQNYLSAIVDYLKADLDLKKLTGNLFVN